LFRPAGSRSERSKLRSVVSNDIATARASHLQLFQADERSGSILPSGGDFAPARSPA